MSNEKIQMPSSGGGIVRYFDEYKSKIKISPKFVVGLILVVSIFGIIFARI
ncbi:MAG: preprotein translocase subunit Sec61beta [Nanoarchaeota archaeon]